jgi:hypothetical protein
LKRQVKCQNKKRDKDDAKQGKQRRDIKSHNDGNYLLSVNFDPMLLQSP